MSLNGHYVYGLCRCTGCREIFGALKATGITMTGSAMRMYYSESCMLCLLSNREKAQGFTGVRLPSVAPNAVMRYYFSFIEKRCVRQSIGG